MGGRTLSRKEKLAKLTTWGRDEIKRLEKEVEWLRFFYDEIQPALGPASDDCIYLVKQEYKDQGNELPEDYDL